jgi:mannitol/fructose-specific phosphotransferase system IIA component (Ntr-type)
MPPGTLLPLADLLIPARIAVPSTASSKDAVLAELVHLTLPEGPARTGLLADVRKREAQFTTALGDGIAMPHARSKHVDELRLSVARPLQPIAFGAADGHPVEMVFLVASPADQPGVHIEALRALSRLFQDSETMAGLRAAPDADAFLRVLRAAEAR